MIPLFKVHTDVEQSLKNLRQVLESGYVGQGPWVDKFEAELAAVFGVDPDEVVTVNSGTSALQLAMALADVKPGDDVVCSPVTCSADPSAILAMGANIVWCDVDHRTGLANADTVVKAITSKTKAVILTDWGGNTPNYEHIRTCIPINVVLIQDAAHNLVSLAPRGDITCYSFQAIKHLHTGDGGALVAKGAWADEARLLRWFGLDRRSSADFRCAQNIKRSGYKFQMNDISAAIGVANLPHAVLDARKSASNALFYSKNIKESNKVKLIPFDDKSPYWIYTVLVEDRENFIAYMKDNGVHCSPVHAICTKHDAFPQKALGGADHFCARNVALPNGWWVTREELNKVVGLINRW